MTSLLLVLPLSASPVLEPWGFSFEAKQDRLVVASVRAGSPAERAKLARGVVLLRIVEPVPTSEQAYGMLDGESLAAAVKTLQAVTAERLVLAVAAGDDEAMRVLERTPFQPKSGAELKAMTPMEQARYYAELSQRMRPGPSRSPGVSFRRSESDASAWFDRATHELSGTAGVEAAGAWLFARVSLRYACVGSRAVKATVRGAGLPEPVVVDLASEKLEGGVRDVLVPVATVASASACPPGPLAQRVELELECEQGAPVLGREKVRLVATCGAPPLGAGRPFSRTEPLVETTTLTEGASHVEVRPPFFPSDAVFPKGLDVLLLDGQGATLQTAKDAWRGRNTDAWKPVKLPAPRTAGSYRVVLEARWADGSVSRSATAPVNVVTKAEADASRARFEGAVSAFEAVQQRMEAQHRDPCDPKTRAWLAKQPEVVDVLPSPGDPDSYSYLVKDFPSGILVHCHGH